VVFNNETLSLAQ